MKKNSFSENLFTEVYFLLSDEISKKFSLSLLNEINKKAQSEESYNLDLFTYYDNITNGILEIAIENDICDYNISEPFMKIFLIYLQKHRFEKNNCSIVKKIKLFGKYDFNSILQSDQSKPDTLKNYFKILDLLREFFPKYLFVIKNMMKESFSSSILKTRNPQLVLDEENYDILDKFYNNFAEKTTVKDSNYSLIFEDDLEISKDINSYLMRFKVISKEMYMLGYTSENNFYCSTDHVSDNLCETLTNYIEVAFDSIVTAIKYNVLSIQTSFSFINFIITLYMDKRELFSKQLLKDIDLFKKYSFIINHIYFPENYENEKDNQKNINNENFIEEKILEKYDINKYMIKTKEDFSLNSEELKNNIFNTGINPYIKDDQEMKIFLSKYQDEKKHEKDLMSNFENAHSIFVDLFKNKERDSEKKIDKEKLYTNPNQIPTFFNSKKILIGNNSPLQEDEIENLRNDEILFCRILIDNNKISYTIDEIIKRNSLFELKNFHENFFDLEKYEKSEVYKTVKDLMNENQESLFNISSIDFSEICRSEIFYNFLGEFIQDSENDEKRLFTAGEDDILLKSYPVFPHIIPYVLKKSEKDNKYSKLNAFNNSEFYKFANQEIRSDKTNEIFSSLRTIIKNQELDMEVFELKI